MTNMQPYTMSYNFKPGDVMHPVVPHPYQGQDPRGEPPVGFLTPAAIRAIQINCRGLVAALQRGRHPTGVPNGGLPRSPDEMNRLQARMWKE